jgi:hypothetical protein
MKWWAVLFVMLVVQAPARDRRNWAAIRVWASTLGDGLVALTTVHRTLHVGAADYWRLLDGDVPPSMRQVGYLAAQLARVRLSCDRRHSCRNTNDFGSTWYDD